MMPRSRDHRLEPVSLQHFRGFLRSTVETMQCQWKLRQILTPADQTATWGARVCRLATSTSRVHSRGHADAESGASIFRSRLVNESGPLYVLDRPEASLAFRPMYTGQSTEGTDEHALRSNLVLPAGGIQPAKGPEAAEGTRPRVICENGRCQIADHLLGDHASNYRGSRVQLIVPDRACASPAASSCDSEQVVPVVVTF
jgi:hypothetical protein